MNNNEIILKNVRLSYCHLFSPESVNGSDPKYSCCILISKRDTATLAALKAKIEDVKATGAAKWGGKVPKVLKLPLRDGDAEREGDEYQDCMFLNASNRQTRPPKVVDAGLNDIIDPAEVYSGCYANVKLSLYAFAASGNNGIAAGIEVVQKTRDGERLGGGGSGLDGMEAEDDFLG